MDRMTTRFACGWCLASMIAAVAASGCGDDGSAASADGTTGGSTGVGDATTGSEPTSSMPTSADTTGGADATHTGDDTGNVTVTGTTGGDDTGTGDDSTGGDDGPALDGVCSIDGWCWVHPMPHGNTIEAWWAASPSEVWAVGTGGSIAFFDGVAWSFEPAFTDDALRGVWGSASDDIWAVGEEGTIVHYDGAAWSELPFSAEIQFADVWGSGPADVWAVGQGVVAHYDGVTWSEVPTSLFFVNLRAVWGTGPDDIWIAGDSIAHYDGVQWSYADVAGFPSAFSDIGGSGPDDVWAVTDTNDGIWHWSGGPSWTLHTPWFGQLRSVDAFDASTAWIVANDTILRWDGVAWTSDPSFTDGDLRSVVQTGPQDAWAGGIGGGTLRWDGATWTLVHGDPTATEPDYGAVAGSGTTPWAAGYNVGSFQQGAWSEEPGEQFVFALDAWEIDGERWLVEHGGGTNVWHDDGTGWSVSLPLGSQNYRAIWGATNSDVWVGGGAFGDAMHYDGAQWSAIDLGPNNTIHGIHGLGSDVWFAGSGGLVLQYDGVQSEVLRTGGDDYMAVWALGPQDVWAVGTMRLDHWNGVGWSDGTVEIGQGYFLQAVAGPDADHVWAVGQSGLFGAVAFGWDGNTWTREVSGSGNALAGLWLDSSNILWAVGVRGSVLRRQAG